MKTEFKNFEADTYATYECLKDLFPLQYNIKTNIIEQSRSSYLILKIFCNPVLNMKYFHEKVLNSLFQHTEFRGCKYCPGISPDIFLKITRSEYSTRFSHHREKTAENLKCDLEDLERSITEKKAALENKITRLDTLIFQYIHESVQKNSISYGLFRILAENAINTCRFLNAAFLQNSDLSSNAALQKVFLSAGDHGRKYLLSEFCATYIREKETIKLKNSPTQSKGDMLDDVQKINSILIQTKYAKPTKPPRCSKQTPWCGEWCGAYSPVELIGYSDMPNQFSPSAEAYYWNEFSAVGNKFIHGLPRTKIIFRQSELQSWLPKTIRSPFDVSCIINQLVARNYISPFTPWVTKFKPGKKGKFTGSIGKSSIRWVIWPPRVIRKE